MSEIENRRQIDEVWRDVQHELPADRYELYKGAKNQVLIVRDAPVPYIVKIPLKSESAWRTSLYELDMCALLADTTSEPPLPVPSAILYSDSPYYSVFEYIPGMPLQEHLSTTQESLSPEDQRQIGEAVGRFIGWLAKEFTPDIYSRKLCAPQAHLHEGWNFATNRSLPLVRAMGYKGLESAVMEIRSLQSAYREVLAAPTLVGHGDLHPGNILVDTISSLRPVGAIDFGEVRPAHAENEMRNLQFLGPESLQSAVTAYQEVSGREVSQGLLRYFLATRSIMMCLYNIHHNTSIPQIATDAVEVLWPEQDWSEIQHWNEKLEDTIQFPARS